LFENMPAGQNLTHLELMIVIVLALPVGMILTAPISGKMADVIGTKKPILVGFSLCVIARFSSPQSLQIPGLGTLGYILCCLVPGLE